MKQKSTKIYFQKKFILPAILIIVLVLGRLFLPFIVKKYVNNILANTPGYYGKVEDIGISLYRGAYEINGLKLNKVNAEAQIPFLNLKKTDISIEWKSILKGRIVSEIIMDYPTINYVLEDLKKDSPNEADIDDWTDVLTSLVPIDINHLLIKNGTIAFMQLSSNPDINLELKEINLEATNLRNVVQQEKRLPSVLNATAISIGNGQFTMEGKMDLIKEIPDMDISLSLENADITALNHLTEHYAGIDFNKGTFSVFSEIAIADGFLKGYVKPIIKNTKLISKEDSFINSIWEGFVGLFEFILKNKSKDSFATKVPIEGDLNNIQTNRWQSFTNILKNGWIKAFIPTTDNAIDYKDAIKASK